MSTDLRRRVVAAVLEDGLGHREAAERFKVSAASVSRWRALARSNGGVQPGPPGGDRKTHAVEAHAAAILGVFEARPDMAIQELRAELARLGSSFGDGTLWRFFSCRGCTRKKSAHAGEQERPDVLIRREAWFEGRTDLDPARAVFVGESWASTNMARRNGRWR